MCVWERGWFIKRQGEKLRSGAECKRDRKGSAGSLHAACKITLGRTETTPRLINSTQHLSGGGGHTKYGMGEKKNRSAF